MTRAARFFLFAILAIGASGSAVAEDASASFPNRPIRLIVPFPAGGPSDIVARVIGQKMSEDWGQPVVIENRPGANTIIGAQAARQGGARRLHPAHGDRLDAGDEPVPATRACPTTRSTISRRSR